MSDKPFPKQIDEIIKLHGDWKAEVLTKLRALVREADSDIKEEVKWKMPSRPEGLPVWMHDGIVCYAEIFKNDIKLVFFKGAELKDPKKLFNARLKSSSVRAIEFREDTPMINEAALKDLVREGVELNKAKTK